jgi:NAD(P)-dependent dehydrogenase (short-subunit alcohol dehydrogenase family)
MPTPPPQAALITGAAHRIGRGLALDLSRQGWAVAVHYGTSRGSAEAVAAEIRSLGGRAAAVPADLESTTDAGALIERAAAALELPLALLVNNASLFEHDTAETLTPQSWQRHLAVNLTAPVLLAQSFDRQLPAGSQGVIVNVIDQRVWRLTPEFFSYTIAKSGLWTATRTLAQALAPRIRVNAIGPGPVLQSIHQTPEEFAAEARSTPLGHGTSIEEIAAALRFILASPALTGQMIALDGGQHLEWRTAGHAATLATDTP